MSTIIPIDWSFNLQLTNSVTGVYGRWLTPHTANHQAPWSHRQHEHRSHERRWDSGRMSTGYKRLPAASPRNAYDNRCTSVNTQTRTNRQHETLTWARRIQFLLKTRLALSHSSFKKVKPALSTKSRLMHWRHQSLKTGHDYIVSLIFFFFFNNSISAKSVLFTYEQLHCHNVIIEHKHKPWGDLWFQMGGARRAWVVRFLSKGDKVSTESLPAKNVCPNFPLGCNC